MSARHYDNTVVVVVVVVARSRMTSLCCDAVLWMDMARALLSASLWLGSRATKWRDSLARRLPGRVVCEDNGHCNMSERLAVQRRITGQARAPVPFQTPHAFTKTTPQSKQTLLDFQAQIKILGARYIRHLPRKRLPCHIIRMPKDWNKVTHNNKSRIWKKYASKHKRPRSN